VVEDCPIDKVERESGECVTAIEPCEGGEGVGPDICCENEECTEEEEGYERGEEIGFVEE
jgi:hypothetical protein